MYCGRKLEEDCRRDLTEAAEARGRRDARAGMSNNMFVGLDAQV